MLYSALNLLLNGCMQEKKPVTPMMQQYQSVHSSLPENTILFFRLGDFYEMFFDDAEIGAKILGLTLTHRGDAPMAGIPFHASEAYIDKLLKAGKKVAICDQMEDPKPGKLVERSLTRILTPGTVLEDSQVEARDNHYIVSLEYKNDILNAAWIDLSTSEFKIASESAVDHLMAFLNALDPKEVILSEKMTSDQKVFLDKLLQQRVISEVPAFVFDNQQARNNLEKLLGVQHLDGFGISEEETSLGCANALVFYITENLCHSPKNLKKITKYRCQKNMILDPATLRNLEIFQTQRGSRDGSLLHFLDVAQTAAGSRLVQQFLVSPLLDLDEIKYRQDCIRVFYDAPMETHTLQTALGHTRDIMRILSRLHNRLRSPRELGAILETLQQLPIIQSILEHLNAPVLQNLSKNIHLFEDLKQLLQAALLDELPNDLSNGGYIRSGFDAQLDHLRSAQNESQTWLQQYELQEQKTTGIRNLRVKYSSTVGFFIEITKSNLGLVPAHYIRKQTMTHFERYYTPELKGKEDLILHAQERAIEKEKEIFLSLVNQILLQTTALQTTAETLAYIDVLSSWSCLAHEYRYCCPTMDDSLVFCVEEGRHPIVEKALKRKSSIGNFVANDLELDSEHHQIMILTGPNMAGKSTYIRQNALLALMAHMGCWVPAKSCRMGWIDRIFSRVGASDNLAHGQSTFMVEMLETANILNNATDRSFIILDEIGRGTSTYDGLSIAWSVVEYLQKNSSCGPRTLFATHYHELTQLEKLYPRIFNAYVLVKEWNDEILFVHQICFGSARRSYGIQVAKLAGLPHAVVERSKVILEKLESEGKVLQKVLKSHTQPTDTTPQLDLFCGQ